MVKDHSDSKRGNPLPPHGLLFSIDSKGSFICTIAFVTPVVEHWLEREIAQWVHPMKDRSDDPSHHERTLLLRSYVPLLSSSSSNNSGSSRGSSGCSSSGYSSSSSSSSSSNSSSSNSKYALFLHLLANLFYMWGIVKHSFIYPVTKAGGLTARPCANEIKVEHSRVCQ